MANNSSKPFHAVVTGGLGGIGQAIVAALFERTKKTSGLIFVIDYLPEHDERAQALQQQGIIYLSVQLTFVEEIKQAFKKIYAIIEEQFPGSHLSLLVNNAGITKDALAIRVKEYDWDEVLDVNLKAAFFCAQQALSSLSKNNGGYIISLSSVVGITGNAGQVSYAASKAGVISMTKTLAKEYATRGILCNAIAPGFIMTPMTAKLSDQMQASILEQIPLKRFGSVQEIANLILFLSSGNADYITGQTITIDGGLIC